MSATPFSPEVVKIPQELAYLTDYITQSNSVSNLVVSTTIKKTVISGGVTTTTTTPRFVLETLSGYGTPQGHVSTTIDCAAAYIETPMPIEVIDKNTVKSGDTIYYNYPTSVTAVTNQHPTTFNVMLNILTPLVGKTVKQVQDYFGADFTIVTIAPKDLGQFYLKDISPDMVLTWGTVIFGNVTASRVLADCIASNIYHSRTGKFLNGPYPWLPKNATIADLPQFKVTTTYVKPALSNTVTSAFPFLRIEGGKLINNTFVNGHLYSELPPVLRNPAGYSFSPTYIIALYNEPTTPYTVDIMGSKVGMGNSNGWIQLSSFDQLNIVELEDETQDGYIDKNTNTFYINPSKKCVFRVTFSQANMGDPFGKTYGWEGAIRYSDSEWSKFYYTL